MDDKEWGTFFSENPPPADIVAIKHRMTDFCHKHAENGTRIVLVTSGGTTVPLEHNTVRFVDNFSAGTRGAASVEYFLKVGYAVIFVHRAKSLEPFSRHLSTQMMDALIVVKNQGGGCRIEVEKDCVPTLLPVLQQYQAVRDSGRLLAVSFTTLTEYLHLLYVAAQVVRPLGRQAMLYLAAAVSDFYIPPTDMATHKISSDEPLHLNLQLVPKALRPLIRHWAPEAFVISFKLETNDDVLLDKARHALEKYGHKLVIANQLHTRKRKVVLVTKEATKTILLSDEEMKSGKEIEEKIVQELLVHHSTFMAS